MNWWFSALQFKNHHRVEKATGKLAVNLFDDDANLSLFRAPVDTTRLDLTNVSKVADTTYIQLRARVRYFDQSRWVQLNTNFILFKITEEVRFYHRNLVMRFTLDYDRPASPDEKENSKSGEIIGSICVDFEMKLCN